MSSSTGKLLNPQFPALLALLGCKFRVKAALSGKMTVPMPSQHLCERVILYRRLTRRKVDNLLTSEAGQRFVARSGLYEVKPRYVAP